MTTGKRRTILIIILLLSLCALIAVVVYPKYMHMRMKRLDYKVYGGMTPELTDCDLYRDMQSGKSFCFMGDSITRGSLIWDIPWYEPLLPYINGEIYSLAKGGWFTEDLLRRMDKIPLADVYVIAIGINDVMSPEDRNAAATAEDYVGKISVLKEYIRGINPDANIYFIAPWVIFTDDVNTDARGDAFRDELRLWCEADADCIYINPVPAMMEVMEREGAVRFMYDSCHPGAPEGVGLYSYAVLAGNN